MFIHKAPVCVREDYVIYLELVNNNALYIHSTVTKWNKKVKEAYKKDLDLLCSLNDVPLYVYVKKEDVKLKKFVEINQCKLVEDIGSAYIYMRSV